MHCHWTLSVHEAHTFPQASVSESCLHLGTDHIPGQISVHIFPLNRGYCFYIEYDHNRAQTYDLFRQSSYNAKPSYSFALVKISHINNISAIMPRAYMVDLTEGI